MAVVHGALSVFKALDLGELQEKRLSIRGQFVAFATFVVSCRSLALPRCRVALAKSSFSFMLASTTYVPTVP